MEIGSTLRSARESRGISLEAAEDGTKIRRKYLEAIESENFDFLPGRVYVKGFLKNYAKYLGLSPDEVVAAYEERVPNVEREEDAQASGKITNVERTGGGKLLKWAAGIAVVGLVVSYIYYPSLAGKMESSPPAPESRIGEENRATPGPNAAQPPAPTPPARQRGVNVTLNVTDNESWMHVEVDGAPVFTGLVPAGQVKEFKGNEKISLKIGNAGVVQVEYNGQKIGVLGGFGQVVTKVFNASQV